MGLIPRYSCAQVSAKFAHLHRDDPWGDRIHVWLALACMFLIGWPTTFVELAWGPVAICFAVRMTGRHRILLPLWREPVVLATGAWVAWQWTATLWSPDPVLAFEEAGATRFALLTIVLWPVLHKRRALIIALLAGFVAGNLSQMVHGVGVLTGTEALQWRRNPDRNSGWWDPALGGSLLSGVLGMHLIALASGRGRESAVAGALAGVTFIAIIATGTRSAWIATLLLIALAGCAWVFFMLRGTHANDGDKREKHPRRWTCIGAALGVVIVMIATLWWGLGSIVERRIDKGVQEVRGALYEQRYDSDTGARIFMMVRAADAFAERPIRGVGVGGYRAWSEDMLAEETNRGAQVGELGDRLVHDHAHTWYLHTGATSGVIGLSALTILLGAAFWGGARRRIDAGGCRLERGYALAPLGGIAGLVFVGAFDVIHVNAQTAALFWALVALCPWQRPCPIAHAQARDKQGGGA